MQCAGKLMHARMQHFECVIHEGLAQTREDARKALADRCACVLRLAGWQAIPRLWQPWGGASTCIRRSDSNFSFHVAPRS